MRSLCQGQRVHFPLTQASLTQTRRALWEEYLLTGRHICLDYIGHEHADVTSFEHLVYGLMLPLLVVPLILVLLSVTSC
jgi:hypothetical protein